MREEAEETAEIIKASFYAREIVISPGDAMLKELYRSESIVEGMAEALAAAHQLRGLDAEALLVAISDEGYSKTAVFVKTFREEREHLVKVVNACKLNGVLDAQVKYIDQLSDATVQGILTFIERLGHTLDQPGVKAAAREFLDHLIEAREEQLAVEAGEADET